MFYAHKGSSKDNTFTLYNDTPIRTFLAFETKEARQRAQDAIWKDSDNEQNLIFCSRKFVEGYMGKDFITHKGIVYHQDDTVYEEENLPENQYFS